MSDTTTPPRNTGSGRRRRSRGGRNRRNNDGNRNNRGNGENRENRGNRGNSENRGNRSNRGQRTRRPPKPAPLTWWQKLLKAIGLYTPPSKSGGRSGPKPAPKSNTRIAKSSPRPSSEARDDREDAPRSSSPPRPQEVSTPRLYVGNLSYDATESDLEELFKGFGSVKSVEIVYNRRTHRSKGYSFVALHHLNDAKRAVEVLHDQPFMGRKLIVNGAVSEGQAYRDDENDSPDSDPSDAGEETN